jgi:KDO2-lipid IV(A) lauroyltransferase
MERLLYWTARGFIRFLQALPLPLVGRVGRAGGALAYYLDGRHRRVALQNLTLCFEHEKSAAEIRAIARENFRRIGENYGCAIKTAAMSREELAPYIEFDYSPNLDPPLTGGKPRSVVVAIGHFGNFELYARFGDFNKAYQCATTYRGLRQPLMNDLLQSLRRRSGCLFFERRFDAAALKTLMNQRGVILGLLADQHAGEGGLRLPFLGRECSTSAAPAVFALRYDCSLLTAFCYRVGIGRWRLVTGEEIPTHENGRPRPTGVLMLEVNRAFEAAVRRDPSNWFWVHNRWKPAKRADRSSAAHSPESSSQRASQVNIEQGG